MSGRTTNLLKGVLHTLYATGVADLARPLTRGSGVIFMLHHVTPEAPKAFDPNGILKVTPDFLDRVISQVREAGFTCISLDEVPEWLEGDRPFAAFTLDDGYKDNRDYAYPVFKRHGVPFTIYVPCAFADGTGDLWWLNLEAAIRKARSVAVDMNGARRSFDVTTDLAKSEAFEEIYWWLRGLPEREARATVRRLTQDAGLDVDGLCADLVMSWDELRALAADPLVSIGAHTTHHYALAKLPVEETRREMADSIARISAELGRPCRHFSYPYGCERSAGPREFEIAKSLGVLTAVTTRKGLVRTAHRNSLTALPRLSLNGDFQDIRYVDVLLSGLPFALLDAAKRLKPVRVAAA